MQMDGTEDRHPRVARLLWEYAPARAGLREWSRRPRRSLATTQGALVIWWILGPTLCIGGGVGLIMGRYGLAWWVGLLPGLLGVGLGLGGYVLGLLHLRRPVAPHNDDDRAGG